MLNELIDTIYEKDPAAHSRLEVILCYPGLHAMAMHQVAHALYSGKRFLLARLVSNLSRFLTGIEIHPGAKIGRRVFIDHGLGVVIGETAVVGDDCVFYQGATLGTGAEARMGNETRNVKRHPTLGKGVIVGSGAEIEGPITVGDGARIASGAVVLKDVPPNSVVAGVPGRILYQDGQKIPSEKHDLEAEAIKSLSDKVKRLEKMVEILQQSQSPANGNALHNPNLVNMVPESAQSAEQKDFAVNAPNDELNAESPTSSPSPDPVEAPSGDPVEIFLFGAGI
jgi:serine O-acetyltransferase